jgi:hypothetical protein
MAFNEAQKADELHDAVCMNEFLAKSVTSDIELSERERYGLKCLFETVNSKLEQLDDK